MRAAAFRPESAEQLGAFLSKPDCDFELKLDGVRVVADTRGGTPTLAYRSGLPADFRELVLPLGRCDGAVFDGEVVAFDDQGKPSFSTLASRLHLRRGRGSVARSAPGPTSADASVCYLVFDLIFLKGKDLTGLPLTARREYLEGLSLGGPHVRVHPALQDGMALLEFAQAHGLEGIVRKERTSPYVIGPRPSESWQKLKFEREDDFVVTGYVLDGARLVSLEIASYTGPDLVLRARVGSGISEAAASQLLEQFSKEPEDRCVAAGTLPPVERTNVRRYVTPKLVASVRYQEWTPDGHLRMPVFRGVRLDAAPQECTAEPNVQASHRGQR